MDANCESQPHDASARAGDRHRKWLGHAGAQHLRGCLRQWRWHQRANGDAAFTVSVDGKQLAGTFCATASHSAGASQNFTLKGDWAPGAHTVTVAFLNDAWGGTTSTDRNLYVNDVTYDGADTKQSAALRSTGSQTFSVTDSSRSSPSRSTASSLAARSPRRRCTPQATARPSPSPLTSDPVSTRSR